MSFPNIRALLHGTVQQQPPALPQPDAPASKQPAITMLRGTHVDPIFDQLPADTVRAEVLRALQNGTAHNEFLLETTAGTLALRVSGIVSTQQGSMVMIDWSHAAILAAAQELLVASHDHYFDVIMGASPIQHENRITAQANWRATGEAYQRLLLTAPGELLDRLYGDAHAEVSAGERNIASAETMLLGLALEAMPLRMRKARLYDMATEIFTAPDDAHSELYNVYADTLWYGPRDADPAALYDHAALMAAYPEQRYVKLVSFEQTGHYASLCAYIHFAPVGQCEKLDRASPHFDPQRAAQEYEPSRVY